MKYSIVHHSVQLNGTLGEALLKEYRKRVFLPRIYQGLSLPFFICLFFVIEYQVNNENWTYKAIFRVLEL